MSFNHISDIVAHAGWIYICRQIHDKIRITPLETYSKTFRIEEPGWQCNSPEAYSDGRHYQLDALLAPSTSNARNMGIQRALDMGCLCEFSSP